MNLIITGAGRGIGYACTQKALQAGHTVLAISRNTKQLESLQTLYPETLTIASTDLAKASDINALASQIKTIGNIDALIHNAGVLINKPFLELTDEDWTQSWEVNLMATVRLTRLCLPYMGQASKGHILHIGSMGGFQGSSKFAGLASYSTTKGALVTLTECLAAELQARNIHVNCLCLGAVDTEMLQQAFPSYKADITPEAMGAYIIDFATQQTHLYNGKVLPVAVSIP